MNSKFIPTLQTGNGYTHLKLKGILDEDNLLVNLLSQIQGQYLLIDMSEVERINSCGVRDWVNWLNQIQALGIVVILLRCSPTVISQANMVANFAADAFIHSFFAPYVDPNTGEDFNKLVLTEDIRKSVPVKAPKFYSESGEELEFDEFEDSYFAFIHDSRILNYQISPEIRSIIEQFMPELNASHGLSGMGPASAVSPVMPKPSQPQRHTQPPLPDANYQPAPTEMPKNRAPIQPASDVNITAGQPKPSQTLSTPSSDPTQNPEPSSNTSDSEIKSHVLAQDNQKTLPLSNENPKMKKIIIYLCFGIFTCLLITLLLILILR